MRPDYKDPERWHEIKSEVVATLRSLARGMGATRQIGRPQSPPAPMRSLRRLAQEMEPPRPPVPVPSPASSAVAGCDRTNAPPAACPSPRRRRHIDARQLCMAL
jgi:hypothetical protein